MLRSDPNSLRSPYPASNLAIWYSNSWRLCMLSRQNIHNNPRPCSPPLPNTTSLIVIPRAHPADSTDYRCAAPSRFICYCPRNPRFHFFRHYTHWHRLASHRLLHFTGASWIRCPKWLLAFGHSTALNFFFCLYFPTVSKPPRRHFQRPDHHKSIRGSFAYFLCI